MCAKEQVSLDRFNEILAENCRQFGVKPRYDGEGDVSVSSTKSAFHNGHVQPNCQMECTNLLEIYEIDPPV